MAQNGWCQQSTLTDFHFDKATQQLTEAGRLKVAQVMTQHPQPFRTMFVVMANSERETAVRLDSVQQTAALVATDGVLPQIHRVAIPPRGWSADEINAIGKKRQETIPTPRLPDNIQSTTGG
jgi:predicted oxidoreductase